MFTAQGIKSFCEIFFGNEQKTATLGALISYHPPGKHFFFITYSLLPCTHLHMDGCKLLDANYFIHT